MNILLIGGGGREHALARALKASPLCSQLFIAPGNAGTAQCGTNIPISVRDFDGIIGLVKKEGIKMVVVGPEDPLVAGLADRCASDPELSDVAFIGPSAQGAQLEGSKHFAKKFMQEAGIPTAAFATFTAADIQDGYRFLESMRPPYVIKASGLAAGKGVVIPQTLDDAKHELDEMLLRSKFGDAGAEVVIEEFLHGIELSVFVLTDGEQYLMLPEAKDYKRIGDGDTGLNTGGMGAVSPVPFAGDVFMNKVKERIVIPTVTALKKKNILYKGFIFIGLMNVDGDPYVIEYNCRLGDPETEAVIPRIKNDFVELLLAVHRGKLGSITLETDPRISLTVIMASGGYPGEYEKGKVISGLDDDDDCLVFHAGTTLEKEKTVTSGGRVLAVTSLGENIEDARKQVYRRLNKISFEGMYCRSDIGKDLLRYMQDTH